jgi:hypothetical protein
VVRIGGMSRIEPIGQLVYVESVEEAAAALRERGLRVSDARKLETLEDLVLVRRHVHHDGVLGLYALAGAVSAAAAALLIALG